MFLRRSAIVLTAHLRFTSPDRREQRCWEDSALAVDQVVVPSDRDGHISRGRYQSSVSLPPALLLARSDTLAAAPRATSQMGAVPGPYRAPPPDRLY
jgi:hypothetical protein